MSAALLMLILTVAPLAIGIVLIVLSRRGGRPYPTCGSCGYDVSGSIGAVDRCPECGTPFATGGIRPVGRARRPVLLGSGIVLIVLAVSCLGTGFVQMTIARERAIAMQAQAQAAQAQALQAARAARQAELATLEAERAALEAQLEASMKAQPEGPGSDQAESDEPDGP